MVLQIAGKQESECNEFRKTIKGTDYLEPFVEKYGEHISDYVRTKRRQKKEQLSNGH